MLSCSSLSTLTETFRPLSPDESSSSGGRQMSSPEHGLRRGSDTDSSVEEESDFDTMPEIESDKNVIRTKVLWALPSGPMCCVRWSGGIRSRTPVIHCLCCSLKDRLIVFYVIKILIDTSQSSQAQDIP